MANDYSRVKPRIGISACLLGQRVRFDGGHKRDTFLTDTFGKFVEWVPVCPELEVGMGVPREAVRLVGSLGDPDMIAERSGRNWTTAMKHYALKRTKELVRLDLSGYIFKKNSPSCGVERVRVYTAKGLPSKQGRGLFAAAVMAHLPLMPVEEEGRLNDPLLRENFIERVFSYHRWQGTAAHTRSVAALVNFHTRHKLLLLAHSERHYRQLGRMVAQAKQSPIGESYRRYGEIFMAALAVPATVKTHRNVLEHMMGYVSKELSPNERKELLDIIRDFQRQLIPLIVPITLVRHYVKKYNAEYLDNQIYLNPSPKELMLRNHV
jgi:uncharacterized protein YbgA (DUF1722 family)/uncharacterized protein YbbK (DUF523 family)